MGFGLDTRQTTFKSGNNKEAIAHVFTPKYIDCKSKKSRLLHVSLSCKEYASLKALYQNTFNMEPSITDRAFIRHERLYVSFEMEMCVFLHFNLSNLPWLSKLTCLAPHSDEDNLVPI